MVSWVSLLLVLVVFVDVVMRYLFKTSFVFTQELEWHLFAFIFLIGAGYTLLHDGHVRVDIIYQRLGTKGPCLGQPDRCDFFSDSRLLPGDRHVMEICGQLLFHAGRLPGSGGHPLPFHRQRDHDVGYALLLLQGYPWAFMRCCRFWALKRLKRRRLMEYLPAWMFLALTILLMAGFPVTFTLMGTAMCFGLIGFGWSFFNLLPLRIWGVMTNVTLIAVPLFVFMGVMLERSGLAEELLDTMGLLFGRLRGGLAISVVVVGALLGASTGIVGATVVTMGLLAVPTMLRRGYQKELATGTVSASGTLGQIIPPSIVLVLIGDIVGVSVGDLFMGAVFPGLAAGGAVYPLHFDHFLAAARMGTGHPQGRTGCHFPPSVVGAGGQSPVSPPVSHGGRAGINFCRHRLSHGSGCRGCRGGHPADPGQPKIFHEDPP
jgi:hypothetical protein